VGKTHDELLVEEVSLMGKAEDERMMGERKRERRRRRRTAGEGEEEKGSDMD
jgi:hypothetical protein